jgi:cytochrome c oxidase subunit II
MPSRTLQWAIFRGLRVNPQGVNPISVWWIFVALGAAWTVVWGWVLLHAGPGPSYEATAPRVRRLRGLLFWAFLATFGVLFAASLRAYPYLRFRSRSVGSPNVTVQVWAAQWTWDLSRHAVPAGVPVEFVVASQDVNHGFAIYAPSGRLLTQVQAMPGYTNHLIYRFSEPGVYTIRCLEYCGVSHHLMLDTLTVR